MKESGRLLPQTIPHPARQKRRSRMGHSDLWDSDLGDSDLW